VWTEQTSPSNLDSIVWPRAASSAEVLVSPPEHSYQPIDTVYIGFLVRAWRKRWNGTATPA